MARSHSFLPTAYLALKCASIVVAWAAYWLRRYLRRRKQEAAQGWSSAEGTIFSGEVKLIPKTSRFQAILTYSYYVGEYRSGRYEIEFSKQPEAEEFARSVKDRRLQIRYKPDEPDVSIPDESAIAQLSPIRIRS